MRPGAIYSILFSRILRMLIGNSAHMLKLCRSRDMKETGHMQQRMSDWVMHRDRADNDLPAEANINMFDRGTADCQQHSGKSRWSGG